MRCGRPAVTRPVAALKTLLVYPSGVGVQFRPAFPGHSSAAAPSRNRFPLASAERRPPGPAHARPPAGGTHPCPARDRVRRRNHDRLPVCHRDCRALGRPRAHSGRRDADSFGRLLGVSPASPGTVHDVRAAREHGVVDALAKAGVKCWADKAYRGADGTVLPPAGATGKPFPPVRRPSTGPTRRSTHSSSRP